MCLIAFAYGLHPRYLLLLAANRDELYDRPTAPLQAWPGQPTLYAGRDLQGGGTWLGITPTGRFAALTNYRDPARKRADAPSRGELVTAFLKGGLSAAEYLDALAPHGERYSGFNLLVMDSQGLYYYSNCGASPRRLYPGLYSLSNHLLDTPWPKVNAARLGLIALLGQHQIHSQIAPEKLLSLLANRRYPPTADLPNTGVSPEWERWLSPIFIEAPGYGTCSSTLLLVDQHHRVTLQERHRSGDEYALCCRWPPLAHGLAQLADNRDG